MIVIGLMSGTSADGIDAATVRVEGRPPALRWELLAHVSLPHPAELRAEIVRCCDPGASGVDRICALNARLGHAFGHAAQAAAAAAGLRPAQIDLIGSHGQTVWHSPAGADRATLQLGSAALIAELTGAPVISNFRMRDMAAGGEGAPLVAYVDTLLLSHPSLPRAAQNIGGIANVTWLPPAGQPGSFAFDTGPGGLLIDAAAQRATAGRLSFDRDGLLAARGQIDEAWLRELLSDPFFARRPPKSTGREQWGEALAAQLWAQGRDRGLAGESVVATLTALTARSIARAYRELLPAPPVEAIVSGGGARNPVLLRWLREAVAPTRVLLADELGLPAEAKEAVAFAILAYESWHGRPGNLPAATGARRAVVLGDLTPGERRAPDPTEIDLLPTTEMLRLMNEEDALVPAAVAAEIPRIAAAVDQIATRMQAGGRLIYIGAGTSGRLGALDASECPPTFGVAPDLVRGLLAGGPQALFDAIEGAEDDQAAGARDVTALELSAHDTLVGIAASGSTPYVLGGMRVARQAGALVVSLACNRPSALEELADIAIAPVVGPEVISGSTRLKAGTAQKLVLNMISTGVMVRLGKTYGNLMVDVQPTNIKLRRRAQEIVEQATGLPTDEAAALLAACEGQPKVAIVAALAEIGPAAARRRLAEVNGAVRAALALGGRP